MATPPQSPSTPPSRRLPPPESPAAPSPPPAATLTPMSPIQNAPPVPAREDDTELRAQVSAVESRFGALYRRLPEFPGPAARMLTEEDRYEDESDLDWENRCAERMDERTARIAEQDAWLRANPDFGKLVAGLAKDNASRGKERPAPRQA
ncbi:hypothetical protein CYLTODRAFT_460674, partial [Cylindrobasidium torrendii FP15055 ss-10]